MGSGLPRREGSIRAFVGDLAELSQRRYWLAVALTVGQALSGGLAIATLLPMAAAIGVGAPGAAPGSSRLAHLLSVIAGAQPPLAAVLAAFVVLTALQGVLGWWQTRMAVAVQQNVMLALRRRLFAAIDASRWDVFSRQGAATILSSLLQQIERVGYGAYDSLSLAATVVTAVIYGVLALGVSVPLTLLIAGTGAALAVAVGQRRRGAMALGQELTDADHGVVAAATDAIAGARLVRTYGRQQAAADRFEQAIAGQRAVHIRLAGWPASIKLWFDVGAAILLAAALFAGVRGFGMAPADLVVLLVLAVRLAPQVAAVQVYRQGLLAAQPAYAAVQRLELELRSGGGAPASTSASRPIDFERDITFDRVSFHYGGREPALRDVSLRIRAGTTVAIVGASGAGKSTLGDLAVGLLSPASGSVRVDDVELTGDRLDAWRRQIGYVPQDVFLFHDTIRANLRWAAPEASGEDIEAAIEAAAAGFVKDLPGGLDTVVGDRGALLSGGERQRIALARALVRRPRLLVLDEATSALDAENERLILHAIARLHGETTVLMITHRLAAVREADWIYVLDDGRVVQSGTWTSLAADTDGAFARLGRLSETDESVPV